MRGWDPDQRTPAPEGLASAAMELPFIDEHCQPMHGSVDVTWTSLLHVLRRQMGGSTALARVLGCDPAEGTARFTGLPGDTVPGFRVIEAEEGRRLTLRGRHRFAIYDLTFVLDGSSLCARTHAAFPGILGRLYRIVVIKTGAHRVITRHLLRQVVSKT